MRAARPCTPALRGALAPRRSTRAALLPGFVGLGALGTFWLNSRIYQITARTFELTERGHLTDRYSRTIEQLGADNLAVRLGRIFALEQIAQDSPRPGPGHDQGGAQRLRPVHSDLLYQYKATLPRTHRPSLLASNAARPPSTWRELDRSSLDVEVAAAVLGHPGAVGAAQHARQAGEGRW